MRAIVIKRYGGPEELAVAERPDLEDHRLMEANEVNGKLAVRV
jgi:NADPH:quinone reductase-like Zn-dependent oxidoreductase